MTGAETTRTIRTVLCRGLDAGQTEQILRIMVPITAEAGTSVIREGDKPQGLLVLVEGTVEIVKGAAGGSDVVISTVDAPTVLGEMSLLTERPHAASVRAQTRCELSMLTRTQFERLLRAESIAAYKLVLTLAEVLARRLSRMDEKVAELARAPVAQPHVEELAAFKQKLFSDWTF